MICNAVDMTGKTWQKESSTQASWLSKYKLCKKLKYITGQGLSEIRDTDKAV